jgi:hypothetical protein
VRNERNRYSPARVSRFDGNWSRSGDQCQSSSQCCPNMPIRKISRSPHEPARAVACVIAQIGQYKQSRKDRKKVEVLFTHLKRLIIVQRETAPLWIRAIMRPCHTTFFGSRQAIYRLELWCSGTVVKLRQLEKSSARDSNTSGIRTVLAKVTGA